MQVNLFLQPYSLGSFYGLLFLQQHSLMNLAWHLFEMDETALGGMPPNVFRGLTIALAIVFTTVYKKRRNKGLMITKGNLMTKVV